MLFLPEPSTAFHYNPWFVVVWQFVTVTCDIMLSPNTRSKIEKKLKKNRNKREK